jgi:ubiquinone/menaquinone biosynthesis C-methylase UbiE
MISASYSKLARIYDRVMSHVNYKMWAEYVNNLFQFSDIKVTTVLDISCGTGKHIKFLKARRRHITGADYSYPMLRIAQKNTDINQNLVTTDARTTAFKDDSFDAVLMLYDSINYLLTEKEVHLLLTEVYRILKAGGIFIFDFVTEKGLKDCYNDYFESNSWNGLAYERHSWFSSNDHLQHNEFIFLFNGQSFKESHIQKIYDHDTWRRLVKKSKMKLSREFSNFSFLAADKQSERIHFICRKET